MYVFECANYMTEVRTVAVNGTILLNVVDLFDFCSGVNTLLVFKITFH